MKVTDYVKARGAVLGKAMAALKQGNPATFVALPYFDSDDPAAHTCRSTHTHRQVPHHDPKEGRGESPSLIISVATGITTNPPAAPPSPSRAICACSCSRMDLLSNSFKPKPLLNVSRDGYEFVPPQCLPVSVNHLQTHHISLSWPFIAPLSFHCDMALYSNCYPGFLPLLLLSFCLNWKIGVGPGDADPDHRKPTKLAERRSG
jgi:hypothetical protein